MFLLVNHSQSRLKTELLTHVGIIRALLKLSVHSRCKRGRRVRTREEKWGTGGIYSRFCVHLKEEYFSFVSGDHG